MKAGTLTMTYTSTYTIVVPVNIPEPNKGEKTADLAYGMEQCFRGLVGQPNVDPTSVRFTIQEDS